MEEFIVTRGAKNKNQASINFLSVSYEERKKKVKQENPSPTINIQEETGNKDNLDAKRKEEREMKKARYEVIKFGMSGLKKTKAREAKVALAISLGAKPPRNFKRNYKEILKEKKDQKQREEWHKANPGATGATNSLKKRKARRKHKKDSGILGIYGTVKRD